MSNAISINNSVLMGRLTRDPELRYTKNNRPVATFKLAVSRRSNAEVTDFIPCVALGGTAEFAARWFQKGTLAIVIGQLTSRVWQDETDGRNHIAYEILCDSVQFGETKKQRTAREQQPEPAAPPAPSPAVQEPVQDNTDRSGLQILALDSITGSVLADAAYDLYTPDGDAVRQHITTDIDGIASIVGLKPGDYMITEVGTPADFRPVARSVNVRLEPGVNHTIHFPHTAVPNHIAPAPSAQQAYVLPDGVTDDDKDSPI